MCLPSSTTLPCLLVTASFPQNGYTLRLDVQSLLNWQIYFVYWVNTCILGYNNSLCVVWRCGESAAFPWAIDQLAKRTELYSKSKVLVSVPVPWYEMVTKQGKNDTTILFYIFPTIYTHIQSSMYHISLYTQPINAIQNTPATHRLTPLHAQETHSTASMYNTIHICLCPAQYRKTLSQMKVICYQL